MNDSKQKPLQQRLQQAGVLDKSNIANKEEDSGIWYLQLILGLCGWLAGIFFIGFIILVLMDMPKSGFTLLGVVFMGIAFGLFYHNRHTEQHFFEHLALALSIAGQACFMWGFLRHFKSEHNSLLMFAVLQTILLLMPHYLHRLLSALAASVAFYSYFFTYDTLATWSYPFVHLLLAVSVALWFFEYHSGRMLKAVQAVAYGVSVAILGIYCWLVTSFSHLNQEAVSYPLSEIMALLGLLLTALAVMYHLFRRYQLAFFSQIGMLGVFAIIALLVANQYSTGLMVSVVLLIVAFAQANKVLQVLAGMSLLGFLSSYYYLLNITLLQKSLMLAVTAVLLLALRWVMKRMGLFGADIDNHAANDLIGYDEP